MDFELGLDWGLDVTMWGLRAELRGLVLVMPVASFYTADLGIACAHAVAEVGIPSACPTEERRYLLGLGLEQELHEWFSVGGSLEGGVRRLGDRDGRFAAAASVAFLATGWSVLHPRVGLRVEDHDVVGSNAVLTLGARLVLPPE